MGSELVPIYEGPTPLADLLREALAERGVRSIQQAVGPFLGIIGDAARTPFSMVLIRAAELESRREAVDECVALVLPEAPVEVDLGEDADEHTA